LAVFLDLADVVDSVDLKNSWESSFDFVNVVDSKGLQRAINISTRMQDSGSIDPGSGYRPMSSLDLNGLRSPEYR
jgi:hypothetical protein